MIVCAPRKGVVILLVKSTAMEGVASFAIALALLKVTTVMKHRQRKHIEPKPNGERDSLGIVVVEVDVLHT